MAPPRLLQLVHGYPPEQPAGTEVYAQRVARGLEARGWQVLTVAAHREPGAPLYAQRREPGLLRVVQNRPFRGLAAAESDPILDRILEAEIEKFRPDLIHVQHL
ncbi:MAG TPA: glycosyltransferase, partial [Myxococcota bacterium]|nr:glycosyltransferase [Myxococcota bacterium]